MLYFSRWDSPEAARDFAKLYADYLPKRYKKAVLQQPASADGMNSTGAQPAITFETNQPQRGNDLRYDMELAFEESVHGCEKEITVNKPEVCGVCQGSGAAAGRSEERRVGE